MFILNAEKRSSGLKAKQLRKKGIIPGVLYGKSLDESLSIQFSQREAAQFLKSNSTGSKIELVIGKDKIPALLKEATYRPAVNEIEHLSFQALVAGEKVTSTAKIILLNREKISEVIQQSLFEISYKALASDLIEKIEIDLTGMEAGDKIRVSDLEIAKNDAIEIQEHPETMVVSIVERYKMRTETDADTDTDADTGGGTEDQ